MRLFYGLEELRRERGLTVRKASELCGLDTSAYCAIEACRRSPTDRTVSKIVQGLDIDPADALGMLYDTETEWTADMGYGMLLAYLHIHGAPVPAKEVVNI